MDAKGIAGSILTAGYPFNWTNETVQRIGIMQDERIIDPVKLGRFANMTKTSDDYDQTRVLFNLRSDYVVYFTDRDENPITLGIVDRIGDPTMPFLAGVPDFTLIEEKNLLALTRVLIFNKTSVKMVVYTWN